MFGNADCFLSSGASRASRGRVEVRSTGSRFLARCAAYANRSHFLWAYFLLWAFWFVFVAQGVEGFFRLRPFVRLLGAAFVCGLAGALVDYGFSKVSAVQACVVYVRRVLGRVNLFAVEAAIG